MAGGDQKSGLTVYDQFGNPAHGSGHDWQAVGHGNQDGRAESFRKGGQAEDVEILHQSFAVGTESGKDDVVLDSQLSGFRASFEASWPPPTRTKVI